MTEAGYSLDSQEALCQRIFILQNTLSLQLCLLPGMEGPRRRLPVAPSTAPWTLLFPAGPQLDLLDALLGSRQPWAGKEHECSMLGGECEIIGPLLRELISGTIR